MSKTINAGRVTFVPKDNFSNNISYKKFDIVTYNGSSYFAKKDTIGHTPTEEEFWQLVAEKGQNGEPGAVKMQVVDTLPETGETDTIYLVKKDNPGEQNLYDEYVYTDTGWEHIGDTSVDLTDYYTKTETDAITGNLENLTTENKSNLVNAINEVANKGSDVEGNELAIYSLKLNGLASGNNVKSSDLPKIDEMINSLFQKGVKQFILRLTYDDSIGYSNAPYTEFIGYNNSVQIKEDQSSVVLDSLSNEVVGNDSIRVDRTFDIYGSWNNGVFETSRARFYSGTTYNLSRFLTSSTALTKDNTIQYTPTSDYNPATKKYVDDQVGNINTILATLTTVSEASK